VIVKFMVRKGGGYDKVSHPAERRGICMSCMTGYSPIKIAIHLTSFPANETITEAFKADTRRSMVLVTAKANLTEVYIKIWVGQKKSSGDIKEGKTH
jgi:hypothetical protein